MDQNELTENLQIEDKDIFTKIWTSPRLIFKYINDNNYNKHVNMLLILAGITNAFDRASTKNLGDNVSLIGILALCIVLGALLGWIGYYLYSSLLSWTGKWLDGKGNSNSILTMLSYAMIPAILTLVLIFIQMGLYGVGIFQSNFDVFSGGLISNIIFFTTSILELTLGIWTLVLIVIGLSEVQKISVPKAILNMLLPPLVILVPIGFIAFILGDLFG